MHNNPPHRERTDGLLQYWPNEAECALMTTSGDDTASRMLSDAVRLSQCLTATASQDALTMMFSTLADAFAADGCVLWESYQGSQSRPDPSKNRMLVLASWFRNTKRVFAVHDLFVDDCLTGRAIRESQPQRSADIAKDARRLSPIHHVFGLKALLAVPVKFIGGLKGAVTLYRCGECQPFTAEDEERLQALGPMIAALYRAI